MLRFKYEKQAQDFLDKTGTTFKAEFLKNDFYFADDELKRDIYTITLTRGDRKYCFKFGQSIANSKYIVKGIEPTAYSVLACLTKYDPGTFENFCAEYGYDTDSRKAEKVYNGVEEEYYNLAKLYSDSELMDLAKIS